jgi:ABC-2 type transport system permease protein
MTRALILKLLRDVRVALPLVCALLAAYQALWVKITERITAQLLPMLVALGPTPMEIQKEIFDGPGKIIRPFIGGEQISIFKASDMVSVGLVHPVTQILVCIWVIGRGAGAIAGEIDRGTMELLLAQPLARARILFAHLMVDLLTLPLVCLSLWFGHWLGVRLVGTSANFNIDPSVYGPGLWNTAALGFAISGFTMWLSARGRSFKRIMGIAVMVTLIQFIINLVGQLWDALAHLRPFTVFYYYQPQQIVLRHQWTIDLGEAWNNHQPLFTMNVLVVPIVAGAVGYAAAFWVFCRRDVPAPL